MVGCGAVATSARELTEVLPGSRLELATLDHDDSTRYTKLGNPSAEEGHERWIQQTSNNGVASSHLEKQSTKVDKG